MGTKENIKCEICGGKTLLKEDDHFRCADCGVCYTPEQLKKMLKGTSIIHTEKIPPKKEKSDPQTPDKTKETKSQSSTVNDTISNVKILGRSKVSFVSFLIIALLSTSLVFFLTFTNSLPKKSTAKKVTESYMEGVINTQNTTLKSVDFDYVEAEKFRTKEEDFFGYFQYMSKPLELIDEDGTITEYQTHFDQFEDDYDPEADVKWAYTMTGTYEATYKGHNNIRDSFRIICVKNSTDDMWYFVAEDYGESHSLFQSNNNSDK